MSVLACDRYGCANIMCDLYSYGHGYLCNECFEELVSRGVDADIDEFMCSSKKSRPEKGEDAREFFSRIFMQR